MSAQQICDVYGGGDIPTLPDDLRVLEEAVEIARKKGYTGLIDLLRERINVLR